MTQMHIPIFPEGIIYITSCLAFKKEKGRITYFDGQMPVFVHDEDDIQSFRMITSQFYMNGIVTQTEIAKAFGVTTISIKRAVKVYKERGIEGFYTKAFPSARKPRVLTPEVVEKVEESLALGMSLTEIALKMNLRRDTLDKAILAGRVKKKV